MENLNSVLIVDDDEDDVFLIQDRLETIGGNECTFVSCSLKEEAVRYLKERTFDICILDYRLAGYEGIDVLKEVADAQLATPIIMLTGQDDDDVAKEAIKLGAQDFVPKSSIDDYVFEKSIRYAVARKELEFAKLLSKAKESENIAKDKFIAHLSHELRTPLTSILGYTSLLLEKADAASIKKELTIISNNGKHLLNLLNDVLDLSKIAAGKFELRVKRIDLQQVLGEINSLLSVSALDKGLSLEFNSTSRIPRFITIDELRFKQVLVNLISNAIKFTDTGSVNVGVEFNENMYQNKSGLRFIVKDSGIGMDASQIKSIFTPFTQLEDVANRKAGGAGLGLSISAEIIKQMGGHLTVESVLDQGSTFTLVYPCDFEAQELVHFDFHIEPDQLQASLAPKLTGKVLIVDDLFEIRQLAGHFVSQTGSAVVFAKNGQEAVKLIQDEILNSSSFDLVLMDLHMPVMTGKEAMKEIAKLSSHPKVIGMTAAISKGLNDELSSIGFTGLIGKPIDKALLWDVLQVHLKSEVNQETVEAINNEDTIHTVHLVEDDTDSADIMSLMIDNLGFEVIHSKTAEQALQHAQLSHVQFHLIDLGLPDMTADVFVEAFFKVKPCGDVLVLSGSHPDELMLSKYPIKQHLIKPINKEILTQILK